MHGLRGRSLLWDGEFADFLLAGVACAVRGCGGRRSLEVGAVLVSLVFCVFQRGQQLVWVDLYIVGRSVQFLYRKIAFDTRTPRCGMDICAIPSTTYMASKRHAALQCLEAFDHSVNFHSMNDRVIGIPNRKRNQYASTENCSTAKTPPENDIREGAFYREQAGPGSASSSRCAASRGSDHDHDWGAHVRYWDVG